MKQSYFSRFTGAGSGESFADIWRYFWPECIATLVLYAIPILLDSFWITQACNSVEFGIFGITNTLIQLVFKVADAISTGIIISCGRYNGLNDYERVGKSFVTAFWLTLLAGTLVSLLLYSGAEIIYVLYNTPSHEVPAYIPFLQYRAISVFFMFFYFPFIGFLRSIKNTRIPMILFVGSSILFVILDYALIFGSPLCSVYGMQGSAIAAIFQNMFVAFGALGYILFSGIRKKYPIKFITGFSSSMVKDIVKLSWPVIIDKAALAFAGMWLAWVISYLGTTAKASYTAIHMFQRIFILPSVACATVITFLVSNRIGTKDWVGIKNTTKKALLFSTCIVLTPLGIISLFPTFFIGLFDTGKTYTAFAAQAFPIITAFVIFDILQVLLSAALRGSREVETVMKGRVGALIFFFAPFSFIVLSLPLGTIFTKFILIYSSFYISNALMALYYTIKLRDKGSNQLFTESI